MGRRLAGGVWGLTLLWTAAALLLNLAPRYASAEVATRSAPDRPLWLELTDPAPMIRNSGFPSTWLPGADRAEGLRLDLRELDGTLPDATAVAVASRHLPPHELHILRMWVAYLLPRHKVVLAGGEDARECCDWMLHYPALAPGVSWSPAETAALVPPADSREARQRRRGRTVELLRTDRVSVARLGVPPDSNPRADSEAAGDGGGARAGAAFLLLLLLGVDGLGRLAFRGLLSLAGSDRPHSTSLAGPVLWWPAGLVAWGCLLHLTSLLGISWTAWGISLVILFITALRGLLDWRRPIEVPHAGPATVLWAVAATLAVLFAGPTLRMRTTLSDFVYHWGLKARWFAEAGGLDGERLAAPAVAYAHPDYPLLWPITWASQSVLAGSWNEKLALAWSPVLLLALAWALLRLGLGHGATRRSAFWGLPAAFAATAFALGYYQGGSPDLAVSVAAALGCLGLVQLGRDRQRPRRNELADDLEWVLLISGAAALAVGSKLEGIVLAALILAALGWLLLRGSRGRAGQVRLWLAAVLPSALVLALWAATVLPHGLLQDGNRGAFDLGALPEVLPALAGAASIPAWRALPWLALLLFPLGLLHRTTRLAALVLLAQNLFYLWAYLATPFDRELLIITSYPRLLAQVVPTMLALGLLALALQIGNDSPVEEAAA